MPIKSLRKAGAFVLADGGSIKARVLRSGLWVGAGQAGVQLLGVVRSIALARLLTPDAFGFMALAMIAIRAIETFTRPGIAQALIARQAEFEDASATAFTLLVARGVILALVLAAAAPLIAHFYEAPALETVLQVLSVTFVITGLSNINTIARQRELEFRRLTYIGQAANLIGTVVTIAIAWWLRSVWALVIGLIVQVSATTALSYVFVGGRMRFAFDAAVARDLFRYGKFITASAIVTFVMTELDSAVIGKLLGTTQLGFYALAASVATMATLTVSQIASGILMPAYSKLQSDLPKLRSAFLRALSLLAFLVAPMSAGLMCLAEPLLHVVYGEKWLAAAAPLQVLAAVGLPRALLIFNGYLFEGIGRPKVAFHLGLLRLAIIGPLVIPMVKTYGLLGAAVTVAIGGVVQWLAGLVYLYRYAGIGFGELLATIWRPVWTAVAMSLVVVCVAAVLDTRTLAGLAATVASGMASYLLLNAGTLRGLRHERFG